MTPSEAFFTVHRDLPREGPGLPADVHWALEMAGTPNDARLLDAASGPGADTVTLAEARPKAQIDAVDFTPHFAKETALRTKGFGARVKAWEGDYTDLAGRYDLIWCAGAMYFKGFLTVLDVWRDHLTEDGAVAFSEPALIREPASPEVLAFWEGESAPLGLSELEKMLAKAGWRIEGQRWLVGAPWEAYYQPMEERLEMLRNSKPDPELSKAISEAEQEIARWRAASEQIAYSLFVVRPE